MVDMMSNAIRCTQLTRRGTYCRRTAIPGSDPPACHYHARAITRPDGQATVGGPANSLFSTGELMALEQSDEVGDLRPEIEMVRGVLRRLLRWFGDAESEVSPEEARRLSSLIFTGARTVALLLSRQPDQADDLQQWLNKALDALSDEYGLEL